jgi:hypothetical protein
LEYRGKKAIRWLAQQAIRENSILFLGIMSFKKQTGKHVRLALPVALNSLDSQPTVCPMVGRA